ncbi:unnamed protein product [Owenia fusiformis]|uniref:Ectonucleotide pyrophosphatase/phosphodiesterase family member 3 n=1 Tax=Owenia fusiformis TaxID=6347 RepID=A0A8S4MWP3_OWEFU|nr:unnamed protein product [Owenia fusiformis]
MHALFTAHGPGFKSQFDMEPLENIELYNMMADLLDVEPASNNGTKGSLNYIMTSPKPQPIREVSDVSCSGDFQSDVVTDCSCDNLRNLTMKSESELNEQLKLTAEEVTQSWSKHHPYGINSPNSSCYFVQRDYVNTYNAQFRMPLLSTFIYDKMPSVFPSDCVRGDPRAKNGRNCSDFISEEQNITHAFLYPPGVSATDDGRLDAAITSNLVPMYNGFQSGIWKFLYDVLEEYREHYSDIHVMVGPAWDYDADGKPDDINNITQLVQDSGVPIPSHFYMSMIRCRVGDSVQQCTGELDVQSFILPHKQKVMNCMKSIDYLQEHVARVRDIELLTGFEFFVNTSFEDAVKIRTFLPGHLWSRDSWVEEPCMEEMKCPAGFSLPPVILVCLDGFRADYLLRNFTPTLGKLASCGTHAPYMRAVYPTKTFPNHYSIVTGLYPESHGIIDNNMYDMKMNKRFSISSSEARNPEWWKGEPIWNTLQKQNKTAATFFWPGSDVKIKGMYPNYYKPYDGKISYQARIDQILTWLDLPEGERPDFLTLYFNEPDLAGHIWGPENKPAMRDILEEVDGYIGKLMNGLLHRDLHNCVNIIVVADHGMAETNCDQVVVLKDWHYPLNNVYVWEGPFGRIANKYKYSSGGMAPLNETEQTPTSKILDDLKCKSEHMKVFDKHWLPKRHHYANNDRIDDVILDMDAEWLVGRYSYRGCTGGNHGYDNLDKSMESLFMAHGPHFKQGFTVEPFENIELYNLLTSLLNVTGVPNNGTIGSLNHMLRSPVQVPDTPSAIYSASCSFPNDEEYQQRAGNDTRCNCHNLGNDFPKDVEEYDKQLNLTKAETEAVITEQVPDGLPVLLEAESACVLTQQDYVMGYSLNEKRPLWTAYTLTKNLGSLDPPSHSCLRGDVRVPSESQYSCSMTTSNTTVQAALFPTDFSSSRDHQMDALITTNVVPMYEGFHQGIWLEVLSYLKQWATLYNKIHVKVGQVFDYDGDGLRGNMTNGEANTSTIASHFFVIVQKCSDAVSTPIGDTWNCANPSILSFLLPHMNSTVNCYTMQDYLLDNGARLKDVELLTGLLFSPSMATSEAPQYRTFLPTSLWPLT